MTAPWWRPVPPVVDRQDEIDTAAQANAAARQEAEATREHAHHLRARVGRIHTALMQEGTDNHFTERWRRAWGGD